MHTSCMLMYVACLSFAGALCVARGCFSVSICFKELHAQCMSLACLLQEHTVWHEAAFLCQYVLNSCMLNVCRLPVFCRSTLCGMRP